MFPALVLLFSLSDVPSPPADAERTADGLVTQRLAAGSGSEKPRSGDLLVLRYVVLRGDGTVVDQAEAPRKAKIAVDRMLPGWRKAVEMMVVGEKRRAWVPDTLGAGKIPAGEQYVIDTELLELFRVPETPADVAAPPEDAIRTPSTLAYKVLRPGTGTEHPKRRSRVVVYYSGWTTDGKLFDSSSLRGESVEFGLDEVIRGWTEGLQRMTVGEVTRFWVPAYLAYPRERDKPQGMLVFDIELVAIK